MSLLPSTPPGKAPPASGLHGPELDAASFRRIAAIAHREAGLYIAPAKAAMVRTRLARRLRALALPGFAAYCDMVEGAGGLAERGAMISALTTNVSHFFREAHHFDILRERLLPHLADKVRAGGRVRIWSAGCSNGQEPYSIAASLKDAGLSATQDVRILGTDIDPGVIAHARRGRYPAHMMTGLSDDMRARHFSPAPGGWQVSPDLAALVSFRTLNLLDDWPMRGAFDAIFCRNVVIYFDAETQARLWPRFAHHLAPEGWLFLGHSERVSPAAQAHFTSRGLTSYQRAGAIPAPARPEGRLA
ncbi:CheR family methyltransferase [Sinisalibacter aestuarii]|uniref:Chemotaxis protein methyltransferase n=1 Tax=Sinisalibacter aestuarii TaxID=2949426 RepID=A0ABQ5LRV9_9RHOB|nr:protein-glutamate O-methyltransferase [Sinisalibacter aestuarii]GKY87698.1 chemotaxis protein methyltransferase [Sinisalibacter aestuarii]